MWGGAGNEKNEEKEGETDRHFRESVGEWGVLEREREKRGLRRKERK